MTTRKTEPGREPSSDAAGPAVRRRTFCGQLAGGAALLGTTAAPALGQPQAQPQGEPPSPYHLDVRSAADTSEPAPSPLKMGTSRRPDGRRFELNSRYFISDGKPWLPVQGEVHYTRLDPADWEDAVLKMKAAGITLIASYVLWIHHEEIEGRFRWDGARDLGRFVRLVGQHGLQCVLRIGPWCHAEVRNGGFPDWLLQGHGTLRSSNPLFLAPVDRLYRQISAQVRGLAYKDGGPLVGIQLENEFPFAEEPATSYMLALKRMAIDAGIDVPLYTQFAWPGGPPGQIEFFSTRGSYPDAPWMQHTRKLYRDERFRFGPVRFDALVGADLFGQRSGDDGAPQPYPLGTAELGSGLQPTYHRRPVLSAADVAALAYVNLGSGTNLVGYYMFHGGSNPLGERGGSLEENRASGYPNDLPLISYDFQAPVGEFGQLRASYGEFRLLHLLVANFGAQLATMPPHFPPPGSNPVRIDSLRYAVRARGGSGFVFANNYRRHLASPDLPGVQLQLQTPRGRVSMPATPVTVPADSYFVWPFRLPMGGGWLGHATVQPVGVYGAPQDTIHVFAACTGIPARYHFEAGSGLRLLDAGAAKPSRLPQGGFELLVEHPGSAAVFSLVNGQGQRLRVLTLTRAQALQATQITLRGQPHLLLTQAAVLAEDGRLRLRQTGNTTFEWALLPASGAAALPADAARRDVADGLLWRSRRRLRAPLPSMRHASYVRLPSQDGPPESAALAAVPQPGPRHRPSWTAVPGSRCWRLDLPAQALHEAEDWMIELHWDGDCAALYRGDTLVADQLQSGEPWLIGLRRISRRVSSGVWRLQIQPFTPARDIALDHNDVRQPGLVARVRGLRLRPVQTLEMALQTAR